MKTIKIGKSCTPSKLLDVDMINATQVLMSYGGGMGGVNKKWYIKANIDPRENGLIEVERAIDDVPKTHKEAVSLGEFIILNTNFIAEAREVRIVIITIDVTEWYKIRKGECKKAIETKYVVLYKGEDYTVIDEYTSYWSGDLEKRTIKTILDVT